MTLAYGPCTQGPRAAHGSKPRKASDIRWAVIHSAEASDSIGSDHTAEAVARFFADGSDPDRASTQLAVDRDSCVRMLPDLVVPWGAPGANANGVHVEICGRATWSASTWLSKTNRPMLDRAAFKVAMWCYHYDIPRKWVGPVALRNGTPGLTTHADVSKAFVGSGHFDPGPNFPKTLFLDLVKKHYAAIKEA